jgi:uncharacterized protein (TIGR02246 family)
MDKRWSDEGNAMSDAEIRARVQTLAQAIRDRDVRALMAHYAPDVVVYDVRPPLDVQGADAYRTNFERWFEAMQGTFEYEIKDLRISIGEAHAFSHCLSHVRGTWVGGKKADYWVRVTTCFQKANGQWLVGHEHVSMPANM